MDAIQPMMASSSRSILVVGPGDCSQCLAILNSGHVKLTTALYDSKLEAETKYPLAKDILTRLEDEAKGLPSPVIYSVDATTLGSGEGPLGTSCTCRYDVIVFYFPHTGVPNTNLTLNVGSNRELIKGFLRAAPKLLTKGGQIQLAVKTTQPYSQWRVGEMMTELKVLGWKVQHKDVDKSLYPGYIHRLTKGQSGPLTSVSDSSGTVLYLLEPTSRVTTDPLPSPVVLHVALNSAISDADLEADIAEALRAIERDGFTAPGYGPPDMVNVLDIRARFHDAAKPDSRQFNRVLYEMERKGKINRGLPRACNMKPTWKLANDDSDE